MVLMTEIRQCSCLPLKQFIKRNVELRLQIAFLFQQYNQIVLLTDKSYGIIIKIVLYLIN